MPLRIPPSRVRGEEAAEQLQERRTATWHGGRKTVLKIGTLLIAVIAALINLVQVLTDPRITRAFIMRTFHAIGLYVLFLSVPALPFLLLGGTVPVSGTPERAALGVVLALVAWFGLGLLLLLRTAPRLQPPPAFWLRFGVVDVALILMVALGVGLVAGVI